MRRIIEVGVVLAAVALIVGLGGPPLARGAEPAEKVAAAKSAAEPVDVFMGDYEGNFTPAKGASAKAEAKVIAEGVPKGKTNPTYRAVLTLAGDSAVKAELSGELAGENLSLASKDGQWTGSLAKGDLAAEAKGDTGGKFDLERIERSSPTEGQKPPEGAIVLLAFEEGKAPSLDEWVNKTWQVLPDGSMQVGKRNNLTAKSFGDCRLHIEFMLPYMPDARGQGRGNSGVYFQDRYEVQMLDSFGLPPKDNECGGIYEVAAPKVNACFPPLRWQTYDIEFHTQKFDAEGKVLAPATLTVQHNGVLIHDKQPVLKETRAAGSKGAVKKGPIMLQDHGCPDRYRNIWILELKD